MPIVPTWKLFRDTRSKPRCFAAAQSAIKFSFMQIRSNISISFSYYLKPILIVNSVVAAYNWYEVTNSIYILFTYFYAILLKIIERLPFHFCLCQAGTNLTRSILYSQPTGHAFTGGLAYAQQLILCSVCSSFI